jgi:hypothetical protein
MRGVTMGFFYAGGTLFGLPLPLVGGRVCWKYVKHENSFHFIVNGFHKPVLSSLLSSTQ